MNRNRHRPLTPPQTDHESDEESEFSFHTSTTTTPSSSSSSSSEDEVDEDNNNNNNDNNNEFEHLRSLSFVHHMFANQTWDQRSRVAVGAMSKAAEMNMYLSSIVTAFVFLSALLLPWQLILITSCFFVLWTEFVCYPLRVLRRTIAVDPPNFESSLAIEGRIQDWLSGGGKYRDYLKLCWSLVTEL
jgi:hypothetical protein